MDEALKPCPFCGSAGTYENARGSYGYYPAKLRIRCANESCYGQTGWFPHGERDYDATPIARQKAATAWNTRADAARDNAEPVAWRYERHATGERSTTVFMTSAWQSGAGDWTETPLYAHPPAPDAVRGDPVARVVEWLRELSGDEPLPPGCTKGEVWVLRRAADAIERGEPFNG